MAARTVAQMAASISRHCGGMVAYAEIIDAIENANKEINTKWTWPWTRAESNVLIQAPYNTGTVSIVDGTDTVNLDFGSGGIWDPGWQFKRIYLGQSNIDLEVREFSTTTATLYQPINFGTDIVNAPYTIFQDMYALPDDCEFGGIMLIVNPIYRYRLRYIPVYTQEWQSVFSRVFFTNFQTGFADCGYSDLWNANLIRFAPAPGSVSEYRLVYRRRAPSLGIASPAFSHNTPPTGTNFLSNTTILPESYDRVVELMAEYLVRFQRTNPLPGWMECKREAYQLVASMRRKMATTLNDNYSSYWQYPYFTESSMYTSGLFITPTTGGQ